MSTPTPEALVAAFSQLYNSRDGMKVLDLYAADALFAPGPDAEARGHAQIREVIKQFKAVDGPLTMSLKRALVSGDTVLLLCDWTLKGKGPDGAPVAMAGTTADVARKQSDGNWRYIIDNPFGTQ